jgi:hypothetical protein
MYAMPRPARFKSPVRDLRTLLEKTQKQFAEAIGVSAVCVERVENRRLGLSRRIRRLIQFETGIDPGCLTGKLRKLRNRKGEPYTKEFYKLWQDRYSWQDEHMIEHFSGVFSEAIKTLLQASVRGHRRRLWQVAAEIAETLDQCRADFNLQQPTNEILAKQRSLLIPNRPLKWEDLLSPEAIGEAAPFTARRKSVGRRMRSAAAKLGGGAVR